MVSARSAKPARLVEFCEQGNGSLMILWVLHANYVRGYPGYCSFVR